MELRLPPSVHPSVGDTRLVTRLVVRPMRSKAVGRSTSKLLQLNFRRLQQQGRFSTAFSVYSMVEAGSFVDGILLRSCPPAAEEATALHPTTDGELSRRATTDSDGERATDAKGSSQQQPAVPSGIEQAVVGLAKVTVEAEAGVAAMGDGRAKGLKKSGEDRLLIGIKT